MSETKKRKQIVYAIGGALLIGAVGYWLYQSSENQEIEEKKEKTKQTTYNDTEEIIDDTPIIDKTISNDDYESKAFEPVEIDDDDKDDDNKMEDKPVSMDSDLKEKEIEISTKSKLAISSGYLLANMITDFFCCNENKCDCMNDDDEYKNVIKTILDNILIQGGACRDLALIQPINDLDIVVNTRELNKIHLQHLKKYHSIKQNQGRNHCCILWNIYLNKFSDECKLYDTKIFAEMDDDEKKEDVMKSNKYIRKCEYILNAKYITNIIMDNKMFINKMNLEYWEDQTFSVFCAVISDNVKYNDFDLKGQDFDILDAFHREMDMALLLQQQIKFLRQKSALSLTQSYVSSNNDEDDNKNKLLDLPEIEPFPKSSLISIRMKTRSTRNLNLDVDDLIDVYLPIYKNTMNGHFCAIDLSINCVMLSLSAVKHVLDSNIKNKNKFDITLDIYKKLQLRVECGVNDYYIGKDFKYKLLTATCLDVITLQTAQVHFWRVIKFAIRYYDDGWRVSKKLIGWHQNLYDEWIDNIDYLNNEEEYTQSTIKQQFEGGYAKNSDQYKTMLEIFITLKFNDKLMNALNKYDKFKTNWIKALNEQSNDIVSIFKQYGYPTTNV